MLGPDFTNKGRHSPLKPVASNDAKLSEVKTALLTG